MPPTINQSEHSYGVRHGVNVHSFSQSERGYSVRHGVNVRGSTNQSATIAYVTVCTSRGVRTLSTNQRAARAYVTVCTSRGVRTLFDQSGHDILMRVRPLNMCAPPRTPSRPLKKKGSKTSYYTTTISLKAAFQLRVFRYD